jgi:uncharacterized protein (TIGR00299 family) protein
MASLRGQHLHFEPTSGIAGDMAVAALVDLGVPPGIVGDAVGAMGVPGLRVTFEARRRGAYVGKGFVVHTPPTGRLAAGGSRARGLGRRTGAELPPASQRHHHSHDHDHGHHHDHDHDDDHGHHHDHGPRPSAPSARGDGPVSAHADDHARPHARPHAHPHARPRGPREPHAHRDYAEIRRLLRRAKLDADARALAEEVFARLARVEAALHGTPVDRVAFHEVGAFDSIADIVGAAAAIAWLSPASIGASYPVVGTGIVRTAHGPVPVPAPATAELLRGIPMLSEGSGELTTPTGAALLACLADTFGPPPPMTLLAIGYGAGTRELADRANVLRVLLGRPIGQPAAAAAERAVLLQSNIDDMSPQLVAALMDALFAAGALDVWSAAITMKKGRAAQEVSALVEDSRLDEVRQAFFLNSTTLGIRVVPVARATLARAMTSVPTSCGPVGIKVSAWEGLPLGAQPEFDDCRRAAARAGVPVKRVWTEALAAAASLVPIATGRPTIAPAGRQTTKPVRRGPPRPPGAKRKGAR